MIRRKNYRSIFKSNEFLMILIAGVFLISVNLAPATVFAWGITYAPSVRVMQQNLYLGADIFKALEADPEDPLGVPKKVKEIYDDINNTDFYERAAAIADEIKANRPDLIGLQEVSIISTQSPSDFFSGAPQPNADTVEYDFLSILLDELSNRGLKYDVAAFVVNADVEFPMLMDYILSNGTPIPLLDDARLTDRDVILVRKGVSYDNILGSSCEDPLVCDDPGPHYQNIISYDVGGINVDFIRGYCAVDATVKGTTYRFVNTHLEVEGSEIDPEAPYVQAFQASELISALEYEPQPIILVGDINSSPADTTPLPLSEPPLFIPRPYWQFSLAGYADVWPRRIWDRSTPGYTCCQEADLRNEFSTLSERIDIIFVRNDLGHPPFSFTGLVFAWTIGDEQDDKTITGMWPSDHAGVVSRLRIPVLR
jgi:endonuclease/exonuclease/phosphatase family metal-dependent hydrolase